MESLIPDSNLPAAVEERETIRSVVTQEAAVVNTTVQTPKPTMDDEEWDYCQENESTIDDGYTLVEDVKLFDIKSRENEPLSASGLLIGPQSLAGLMDLVLKSVGDIEIIGKNGQKTTLTKILYRIDKSVTGTCATIYKQHAACSVLLQRYLLSTKQLREMEIFLTNVTADIHLKGAGISKSESKLQEKRGKLHEVRETLHRFAQQVKLKDQQIAQLRKEVENNRRDYFNRLKVKEEHLTELQIQIAELENGQETAQDDEQPLRLELADRLDRIIRNKNADTRKIGESEASCVKEPQHGTLPAKGMPSWRSRYTRETLEM